MLGDKVHTLLVCLTFSATQDSKQEVIPEMKDRLKKAQDLEVKIQTLVDEVAKLKGDSDYLSPDEINALKVEIDFQEALTKSLEILRVNSEEEEFKCKICFELSQGVVYACTVCEFLMCDHCKTRYCERDTRFVQCPGCRAEFCDDVNPRRSRMAEKSISRLRKRTGFENSSCENLYLDSDSTM